MLFVKRRKHYSGALWSPFVSAGQQPAKTGSRSCWRAQIERTSNATLTRILKIPRDCVVPTLPMCISCRFTRSVHFWWESVLYAHVSYLPYWSRGWWFVLVFRFPTDAANSFNFVFDRYSFASFRSSTCLSPSSWTTLITWRVIGQFLDLITWMSTWESGPSMTRKREVVWSTWTLWRFSSESRLPLGLENSAPTEKHARYEHCVHSLFGRGLGRRKGWLGRTSLSVSQSVS